MKNKYLNLGLALLLIALILGISRGALFAISSPAEIAVPLVFITIIFTALTIFILYRIYMGDRWAKIFFLCYFILGLILNFSNVFTWFVFEQLIFYIYVVESILNLAGLIFVFRDE